MSNKGRLYVALYARGGAPKMAGLEDTYHWSYLVGPKIEGNNSQGTRYHAKESLGPNGSQWIYEIKKVSLQPTSMLLVRILIGKIEDLERLESIFQSTPISAGDPNFNCVVWMEESLKRIHNDSKALGTKETAWKQVRDVSMSYCAQKKASGRFNGPRYDPKRVPTFDLIQHKETVS